jgi:hypothetical protein
VDRWSVGTSTRVMPTSPDELPILLRVTTGLPEVNLII